MNKYICKGAFVQRKSNEAKCGVVIAIDRKEGILIAEESPNSYWTDKIKNVKVVSYKEVE